MCFSSASSSSMWTCWCWWMALLVNICWVRCSCWCCSTIGWVLCSTSLHLETYQEETSTSTWEAFSSDASLEYGELAMALCWLFLLDLFLAPVSVELWLDSLEACLDDRSTTVAMALLSGTCLSVWELVVRDNDPDESGGENQLTWIVISAPKTEPVALPFGAPFFCVWSRSLDVITGIVKVLSTESGTGYTKSRAGEHNTNNNVE